jgi:hypothetical protein
LFYQLDAISFFCHANLIVSALHGRFQKAKLEETKNYLKMMFSAKCKKLQHSRSAKTEQMTKTGLAIVHFCRFKITTFELIFFHQPTKVIVSSKLLFSVIQIVPIKLSRQSKKFILKKIVKIIQKSIGKKCWKMLES